MSERQDNTKVNKPIIIEPIKLTPQQVREQKAREIQKKNRFYIFDKDKATYFRNMQNFYNNNAFGYGIQGRQTNYDYAKGNVTEFMSNIAGAGTTSAISEAARKAGQLYSKVFRGSVNNVISEVESMLKKYKKPIKFYEVDNGSYNRGLRTYDGVYTSNDLEIYDAQNVGSAGGGHFFYFIPETYPAYK